MDLSNLTVTQLTACANAFKIMDEIMMDDIPSDFIKLLDEYMSMEEGSRIELLSEISAKANFLAYAETLGAPEIADALQKVAEDMTAMDSRSLNEIAKSGVSKLVSR